MHEPLPPVGRKWRLREQETAAENSQWKGKEERGWESERASWGGRERERERVERRERKGAGVRRKGKGASGGSEREREHAEEVEGKGNELA